MDYRVIEIEEYKMIAKMLFSFQLECQVKRGYSISEGTQIRIDMTVAKIVMFLLYNFHFEVCCRCSVWT